MPGNLFISIIRINNKEYWNEKLYQYSLLVKPVYIVPLCTYKFVSFGELMMINTVL